MRHILGSPTRPRRVVCIGECMVEMAPRPDGAYAMGFAGDVFNTAWYLAGLRAPGLTVDFVTAAGSDDLSDRFVAFARDAGLGTGHVQRRGDATLGLYLIRLDGAERHFSYWRGQSAARRMTDDPDAIARALDGADLCYLSGITLAILGAEGRARLLSLVAASGVALAFDPNIRPALWPDAATMRDAITRAGAGAAVVLPSFDDELRHFGDATPADTARRYGAGPDRMVVVKNADAPMLLADGASLQEIAPVAAPAIVDTTAAGDSFNAGFLAALLTGAAPADAVAAGAGLAARVLGARGALVPQALARP